MEYSGFISSVIPAAFLVLGGLVTSACWLALYRDQRFCSCGKLCWIALIWGWGGVQDGIEGRP